MTESDKGTEITCNNCTYEWTYTGDLPRATCPACGNKTPVETEESDESEESDTGVPA